MVKTAPFFNNRKCPVHNSEHIWNFVEFCGDDMVANSTHQSSPLLRGSPRNITNTPPATLKEAYTKESASRFPGRTSLAGVWKVGVTPRPTGTRSRRDVMAGKMPRTGLHFGQFRYAAKKIPQCIPRIGLPCGMRMRTCVGIKQGLALACSCHGTVGEGAFRSIIKQRLPVEPLANFKRGQSPSCAARRERIGDG